MERSIENVKNWMNMFRWIVKLIRDDYGVEETRLTRNAVLENDLGLEPAQIGEIMGKIGESFGIRFPPCAQWEIDRLEELCLVASWLNGFYRRPDFVSLRLEARCRAINPFLDVDSASTG